MHAKEVLALVEAIKPKLTLYDLYKNTAEFQRRQPSRIGRVPPPHQELRILEWSVVPFVGTKSLLVTALVEPGTPGRLPKKAIIKFYNVEFAENPAEVRHDPDWYNFVSYVKIPVRTGGFVTEPQEVAFKKINAKWCPVQVRCNCEDFYFRFGWYLKEFGSFYGKGPKPYQRKTTWWPSQNRYHIPAMCKHLWNLARALERAGVLYGLPPIRHNAPPPNVSKPTTGGKVEMSAQAFVKFMQKILSGDVK